ncbi:MAG: YbaB/EbfC family nucleoid-associated protein [Pseudomonadota bacterium]
MLKGLGQLGDMAKMMKQAQEVQAKMTAAHEGLEELVVEGEAGAGLVKVRANAKGDILGIEIDPSLFEADQREVVEDLIVAGVKDAQTRGRDAAQAEIAKVTEELGLPAGMKLPF